MSDPLVSVVIPTYNQRPSYLLAAVETALEQTVPVEVLVVDDGSSPAIADLPDRARVIRHETNRGIAAALNTGIRAMTTEWFAWLSSDDMMDSTKLETQIRETTQAGLWCSFHQYRVIRHNRVQGDSYLPRWSTMFQQRRNLAALCEINGSTALIHRRVFEDVGVFDEAYRYGQDWEMWNRIGQKYLWLPIPQVLGSRREGENLTASIESDPQLKAMRDDEDARIRDRYRPE